MIENLIEAINIYLENEDDPDNDYLERLKIALMQDKPMRFFSDWELEFMVKVCQWFKDSFFYGQMRDLDDTIDVIIDSGLSEVLS